MLSYTFLPHLQAVKILLKLSSIKIIPAASLATSVPAIPIANLQTLFNILSFKNIHLNLI